MHDETPASELSRVINPAAFPKDAVLPGIAVAVDPAVMSAIFQRSLRPGAAAAYRVETCRHVLKSYRPGRRCILQYVLELVDTNGGRRCQVRLSGAIYPGARAWRHAKKLKLVPIQQSDHESWQLFEPSFYVAEAAMLVQVYPFDQRLPVLPRVMTGPLLDSAPPCLHIPMSRPCTARCGVTGAVATGVRQV